MEASSKTVTQKKRQLRVGVLEDNIKDQDFNWAECCELGSSPPSTEAAKELDAMGSRPGYLVKTGDTLGALYAAVVARHRNVGRAAR